MDAKQNISSIRHFLKKRHWVSDVFTGMCLTLMPGNIIWWALALSLCIIAVLCYFARNPLPDYPLGFRGD